MTAAFNELVSALKNPDVWPDRPDHVEWRETHISWVFLTRKFAWKIKKPVSYGFLDFSTLPRRKHFCEEELRLNGRAAPVIYLDVVPICGEPTAPLIDGGGEPFEFAVRMRRFNDEGLLSRIADEGRLTARMIDDLAETVADFHLMIPSASLESDFGHSDDIRRDALNNFSAIEEVSGDDPHHQLALRQLRSWTIGEADRIQRTLSDRRRDGFIRECHGDLHLGNIVEIDGQPYLFDGIDFNEKFRWIDVISDVAFLVMDLEEHGASRLARRLLNRYLERTGDYAGLDVLRFYLVYRAMVRAKVDAIRLQEERRSTSHRRVLMREFGEYLKIADHDAEPTPLALIITQGPSGSGKSFLSQRLIEDTCAIRVRSDIERKRIFGVGETERVGSDSDSWLYSTDASRRTYDRLESLATAVINAGFPVIVDAAFLNADQREPFRKLARRSGIPFRILSCTAPAEELAARIETRRMQNRDASDASVAVLQMQLSSDSGISDEPADELINVNTAEEASISKALTEVTRVVS